MRRLGVDDRGETGVKSACRDTIGYRTRWFQHATAPSTLQLPEIIGSSLGLQLSEDSSYLVQYMVYFPDDQPAELQYFTACSCVLHH